MRIRTRQHYLTTKAFLVHIKDRCGLSSITWIATYLLGIAFICFLPPWEGYDEVAHYSYAQQIADIGEAPSVAQGRLSANVEAYQRSAPMPYSTTPPFDNNGGITYRTWFSHADSFKGLPHGTPPSERHFSAGMASNWQAQHPALYYRLIGPVLVATADLSWVAQLFMLRVFSWSLAFAGLVIGVVATSHAVRIVYPEIRDDYSKIALAWPLLLPGFLPEFARLGNDSLVLLILSLVWALLVRRVISPQRWYWYGALGVLLGLGGLTKVMFLPVSIAVFGWLVWMGARSPESKERFKAWSGALLVIAVFFAFTGEGYLSNLMQRGSLTGLVELSGAAAPGSFFWLGAVQHPFEVVKGILGIGMTFVWGGTASSAYPPVVFVLPVVLVLATLLCASFGLLAHNNRELAVLAVLIVGAVCSGLIYYLLVRIAATGVGSGAPGWYLHTLIAPLGLLLAAGWKFLRDRFPFLQSLWGLWLAYMVCFCLAVGWLQAALFTGCSFKTAESRIYSFADWTCLMDISEIYSRLEILAYPGAGLLLVGLAVLLAGLASRYCRSATIKADAR